MLTKEQGTKLIEAANGGKWRFQPTAEAKAKALNTAISSFAPQARQEEIFALYDTTIFGSGKTGFLLTSEALYHDGFPFLLKKQGTTTRLPLAGLKSVRAVPGEKLNLLVIPFTQPAAKQAWLPPGGHRGRLQSSAY